MSANGFGVTCIPQARGCSALIQPAVPQSIAPCVDCRRDQPAYAIINSGIYRGNDDAGTDFVYSGEGVVRSDPHHLCIFELLFQQLR